MGEMKKGRFTLAYVVMAVIGFSFLFFLKIEMKKETVEKRATARDLISEGFDLMKYRRYAEAKKACAKALEANPRYSRAYLLRGLIRHREGHQDTAMDDFNKAVELAGPLDNVAYYCRGLAWAEKGDYDRAISDYNMALIMPGPEDSMVILYKRGTAYYKKGDSVRALVDLRKALEAMPPREEKLRNSTLKLIAEIVTKEVTREMKREK